MSQTPGVHDMDRRILETLIWESNPGEHSDPTVFYVCVSLIIYPGLSSLATGVQKRVWMFDISKR